MNKFIAFFLSIASFFATLFGLPGVATGKQVDMSRFELTFSDEFTGNKVNEEVWGSEKWWHGTIARKGGYWNNSLASVDGECLHIPIKYLENGMDDCGKGWYSCELTTASSFEQCYGYYECRCILPKGAGLWSAFWMMCGNVNVVDGSGVDGAEIDIYESPFYSSLVPKVVSSAIHYDGYNQDHKQKTVHKTRITANNPYEEFNTYSLEWNKDEYIFYINGIEAGRTDFGGACQQPGHIILSVEVGGNGGIAQKSWAGESIETNKTAPTDFIVDYVRAYQYKELL